MQDISMMKNNKNEDGNEADPRNDNENGTVKCACLLKRKNYPRMKAEIK